MSYLFLMWILFFIISNLCMFTPILIWQYIFIWNLCSQIQKYHAQTLFSTHFMTDSLNVQTLLNFLWINTITNLKSFGWETETHLGKLIHLVHIFLQLFFQNFPEWELQMLYVWVFSRMQWKLSVILRQCQISFISTFCLTLKKWFLIISR